MKLWLEFGNCIFFICPFGNRGESAVVLLRPFRHTLSNYGSERVCCKPLCISACVCFRPTHSEPMHRTIVVAVELNDCNQGHSCSAAHTSSPHAVRRQTKLANRNLACRIFRTKGVAESVARYFFASSGYAHDAYFKVLLSYVRSRVIKNTSSPIMEKIIIIS